MDAAGLALTEDLVKGPPPSCSPTALMARRYPLTSNANSGPAAAFITAATPRSTHRSWRKTPVPRVAKAFAESSDTPG
jgi:hypothetical protein